MAKIPIEDDFRRTVLEALGKEGKSISSLSKELERQGHRYHRLIITGYLRALADMQLVKEKDVPPSKVYVPLAKHDDSIYTRAREAAEETADDPDLRTLQALHSILRRPVYESELREAEVGIIKGVALSEEGMAELRAALPKRLKSRFGAKEPAYLPEASPSAEDLARTLEALASSVTLCRHLVLDSRQSKLI